MDPKKSKPIRTHTQSYTAHTHRHTHTRNPSTRAERKRKLQNSSNNGEKAKFRLVDSAAVACKSAYYFGQTNRTHTERDHKFPVCVCVHYALICAIYLRCVNFFLLLNRQPSGGARGNGNGGMAEHRNQDGHTQTTHTSHTHTPTHTQALLSLTTSPAAPAG